MSLRNLWYLPVTRMNLVGLLDNGVLAPPRFLQRRKYYSDFSGAYPDQLLLFQKPVFPKEAIWSDTVEDQSFGVIIELRLAPDTIGVHAVLRKDGLKECRKPQKLTKASIPALVIDHAVHASCISRLLTPGKQTARALREDPYLADRAIMPPVEAADVSPCSWLSSGSMAALSDTGGSTEDPDRVFEKSLAVAGGAVLLSELCRQQRWADGHGLSSHVLSVLVSIVPGPDETGAEVRDYTYLEAFQRPRPPDLFSPAALGLMTGLAVSSEADAVAMLNALGRPVPTAAEKDEAGEEDLRSADALAMVLLIREALSTRAADSTPGDLLDRWKEKLELLSGTAPMLVRQGLDRLHKAVDIVVEVLAGREPAEQLFKPSVDWARSIRAALAFGLRPEPQSLIDWPDAERPARSADVSDLMRAAYLCGAYHGYTRLPISIKDHWTSLMKAVVFGSRELQPQVSVGSSWASGEEGKLVGALVLSINGAEAASVHSTSSIRSMIAEFAEVAAPRIKNGEFSAAEALTLALISDKAVSGSHRMLEITVTPELRKAPAGSRVSAAESRLKPAFRCDQAALIDELADAPPDSVAPAVLELLCDSLGVRFSGAIEVPVRVQRDAYCWLEKRLNLIDEQLEAGNERSLPVAGLEEIHSRGLAIARAVLELLRCAEPAAGDQITLLSALMYLVLDNDAVADEHAPGLGLVDDWIALSDAVAGLAKPEGKARRKRLSKNLADVVTKAVELQELIEATFGGTAVRALRSL